VLETVSVDDVAKGKLPKQVKQMAADPASWEPR
jgi:hypothetical protein